VNVLENDSKSINIIRNFVLMHYWPTGKFTISTTTSRICSRSLL